MFRLSLVLSIAGLVAATTSAAATPLPACGAACLDLATLSDDVAKVEYRVRHHPPRRTTSRPPTTTSKPRAPTVGAIRTPPPVLPPGSAPMKTGGVPTLNASKMTPVSPPNMGPIGSSLGPGPRGDIQSRNGPSSSDSTQPPGYTPASDGYRPSNASNSSTVSGNSGSGPFTERDRRRAMCEGMSLEARSRVPCCRPPDYEGACTVQ
jgi:hypothetical protein